MDLKRFGSPAWIRTTIHGSKGRCPTIRRPGSVLEGTELLQFTSPLRVERALKALEVGAAADVIDTWLGLIDLREGVLHDHAPRLIAAGDGVDGNRPKVTFVDQV